MGSLLQTKWEEGMHTELTPFGINLLDFEREAHRAAKGSSSEVHSLTRSGGACWLDPLYLHIGPLGIAFPLDEILPNHLDRRGDDGGGTDR